MSKQKMTIFSKPDEMGRRLQHRAMWLTLAIVNIIWVVSGLYSFVFGGENIIAINTLLIVDVLFISIYAYLHLRMTRGGSDKE